MSRGVGYPDGMRTLVTPWPTVNSWLLAGRLLLDRVEGQVRSVVREVRANPPSRFLRPGVKKGGVSSPPKTSPVEKTHD